MNWMENLQNAIAYIEENLTEEIKVRDVAEKHMFMSSIFNVFFLLYVVLM